MDGFFSFPNFTRLATATVVGKAVARGVNGEIFGYVSGAKPVLGADGKYQVAIDKVRIGVPVAEDEIDLDGGFIMAPETIPPLSPASPSGAPGSVQSPTPAGGPEGGGGFNEPPPTPSLSGAPTQAQLKTVELSFAADRSQLYTAWQALANLADLCGTVTVSVKGELSQGLDKGKLENGVFEPLREANLIE